MLKLELGCGMSPTPGYVHHDRIKHSPHVDLAWDLRRYPWPFVPSGDTVAITDVGTEFMQALWKYGSGSVAWPAFKPPVDECAFLDEILSLDVFEHLSVEIEPWLDECWRLLCPDGRLVMRLPCWDNPLSYRDPTHLRMFHVDTFRYWDPDHDLNKFFGALYFAESAKWWKVEDVVRENGDWRYTLTKRG